LSNTALWHEDLTQIPGLTAAVQAHLEQILQQGALVALSQL
jgi:mannitol-1-phosphate/altronate dehydrogenase